MKIMVVEDDENSRILQENVLEMMGYIVESASNGREALEMIRRSPPDLVISDILMPEMDGYALCQALKSDEKLRAIPVVFYTATYTDPKDERFAMELGASRFIVKPIEVQHFLHEIEKVLDEHHAARLTAVKAPLKDKIELNRTHADVLTRKLDKKIRDLEEERQKLRAREEELRRTKESLQKAQEIARLGNWDWNILTNELWWSDEIYNIFGLSRETFGATYEAFLDAVHPDDRSFVRQSVETALSGKKPYSIDHFIVLPDGTQRFVHEQAEVIFDESLGEPVRMIGTVQDITERKRMEEEKRSLEARLRQAQKIQAIGTLAGGIAHDFNNILTPILGYAEMVLENLPPGSRDRVHQQEIIKAAERAKDLVIQILTFSRQTEQERKPVQLQSIVKEALKLIRSSIPSTIEIRQDLDPNAGAVMADPTQLHQILMNLCTNAYHAMRENGGLLNVSLSRAELGPNDYITDLDLPPGDYLRLEMSDTGCGMDKNTLERIFDPYFTTKEKGEGTGLGLAVVHGIVKSHGGHISVYSEPNEGTTFHIYLPMLPVDLSLSDSHILEPLPEGSEHILLVEDETQILQMEHRMLNRLGYRVSAYSESDQALEAFREACMDYDLVVTDMTMPKMTGAELAQKVLAIRPDIPVVLCSGFSEIISETKAKALGIRKYVMKPLAIRDFARVVREVLDEST